MTEYKQCSYSLHKAIKQAKRQYRDKVESQFDGSDTKSMWQSLQSITDYKKKTSPVTDQDVLLQDRLNTFFAHFEDNTVPLTRPTTKTCGLSFTAADVSETFKRINPRRPRRHPQPCPQSMHRPAGWCVYGHIQSILIPVCCSHMLQEGHHCFCSQES